MLESGIYDSSDPWTITDTKPPVPASPSVFAGLAKVTRVCLYDRPGTIRYDQPAPHLTGRSTPVDNPRSLDGQADDLAVLARGKVPGPYLLVAHSYGGISSAGTRSSTPTGWRASCSSTPSRDRKSVV